MTTTEVLEKLRAEGFPHLQSWAIGKLIQQGKIPRPRLNSSLAFDWKPRDVSALRQYLAGRPKPKATEAAVS